MDTNTILSSVAVALSIGGTILAVFNHKRLRSRCCSDKERVISFDVESTTPPNKKDLKIVIPPNNVETPEVKLEKARDILYSA